MDEALIRPSSFNRPCCFQGLRIRILGSRHLALAERLGALGLHALGDLESLRQRQLAPERVEALRGAVTPGLAVNAVRMFMNTCSRSLFTVPLQIRTRCQRARGSTSSVT